MSYLAMRNKQTGLSLVELMVTVVISLILLLGVVELYSNTSRTDRSGIALSELQDDARVSMEFIKRDIRRSGYTGCIDSQAVKKIGGVWVKPISAGITAANSNSFTLTYASPTMTLVDASSSTPDASKSKDYLLTNCTTEIETYTGELKNGAILVTPNAAKISLDKLKDSNEKIHIYEFNTISYSLNNNELRRNGAAIIGDINAITFSYGVTQGATTTWTASPTAAQLDSINQVKISMTLTSATDAAVSRTFTSVVQLRNRI